MLSNLLLIGDRVVEINARRMEGLSRGDAMEWLKACDTATLVLERIDEVPHNQPPSLQPGSQSQLSSFDGVRKFFLFLKRFFFLEFLGEFFPKASEIFEITSKYGMRDMYIYELL